MHKLIILFASLVMYIASHISEERDVSHKYACIVSCLVQFLITHMNAQKNFYETKHKKLIFNDIVLMMMMIMN